MKTPLLELQKIKKNYGQLTAVNDFSLNIYEGETVGLVGESGSGKTTVGRSIIQLHSLTSGTIKYQDKVISTLSKKEFKPYRKEIQMIFQDPYASLNPRMTIEDIVAEPLDIHKIGSQKERKNRVEQLLEMVGLSTSFAPRFPHELSGGQRQRVGIARALAVNPKCIICDEAISALDVSVQAQIINLLKKLQKEMHLTYLFIAHDLNMVKYISDRIAVMHRGNLVEVGTSNEIFNTPKHPYTQFLLSSIPQIDRSPSKEAAMPLYHHIAEVTSHSDTHYSAKWQ